MARHLSPLLLALCVHSVQASMAAPQLSRRAVAASAASAVAVAAASPTSAASPVLAGVTPAKALTIGEYVRDLKSARAAVQALAPLLDGGVDNYERVRVDLRKPPANGIRKASTKILAQLEGTNLYSEKSAQYEEIKTSLAALDDGCRLQAKTPPPQLVAEAEKLATLLDAFAQGCGATEE